MRLPGVLRELIERLCADDWERFSAEDGRFYYIVGAPSPQQCLLCQPSLVFKMLEERVELIGERDQTRRLFQPPQEA